ncbi:MAG TPA: molybdopterin molybdenumtransferase MoeA [Cycloclasticus sp.]|jgi:molybdopterin molybdotransferase|nr:molybdopterin molybdotransferase MoeA [Cycloclasticus sp.]HIL92874.1 molybdopterin molybdenumtransferase MoeA [Cycloclasticus sp.]
MTDCCATPGLLSLKDALTQILSGLPVNKGYERLSLKNALHRIVYHDIKSAIDVPSFRNSSMDGYAMHSNDSVDTPLSIIGTSWAGSPYTESLAHGECIRIFTGAYVPNDCDCVVMQENTTRINDTLQINQAAKPDENIRNIADDTSKNQTLFVKGESLKPADIGLLASCGVADVAVFKKITVGFFSTGDELVSIGSQPTLGQIFDSNRYTLNAMLIDAGVTPIDMGVIADNQDAVESVLLAASKHCDMIITSGGVSVGEADFITDVLAKIGNVNLWKIAIKPGKPLVFGSINDTTFFGLPGNPVSVMVTFKQVILPAIKKLMGHQSTQQSITLQATTTETIKKQPGRMEFQRGIANNVDGNLTVSPTGRQGSHMLSSMSKANCLIVLEQDMGDVKKGQSVTIQLLGTHL